MRHPTFRHVMSVRSDPGRGRRTLPPYVWAAMEKRNLFLGGAFLALVAACGPAGGGPREGGAGAGGSGGGGGSAGHGGTGGSGGIAGGAGVGDASIGGGAGTGTAPDGGTSDGQDSETGDAGNPDAANPVLTFAEVQATHHHACGGRAHGSIACWGLSDIVQSTPTS